MCFPNPTATIFNKPLSISPEKSVCGLILATIIIASANIAFLSMYTGILFLVSPSFIVFIEEIIGILRLSLLIPKSLNTFF
jgi:hypothetical protein